MPIAMMICIDVRGCANYSKFAFGCVIGKACPLMIAAAFFFIYSLLILAARRLLQLLI